IVADDKQLSTKVKKNFLDEQNEIFLSIASLWEIAIKVSLDRLELGQSLSEFYFKHVIGNKIRLLDIKVEHLAVLENLEYHHRNPFDRILIAQCLVEKMSIISKDKTFSNYSIKRIW
ncbi:MAG TPA: type II toxin-antitoxin system VapC family toxin, partial [Ignavibacteriaceae bacterium]|nr:type II toxin-antitoxin system VapC family toxin [Ignavibacteriaceae bacterium]